MVIFNSHLKLPGGNPLKKQLPGALAKLFPPFAAKLLELHEQLRRSSSLEWSCVAGDCLVMARQLEETGI